VSESSDSEESELDFDDIDNGSDIRIEVSRVIHRGCNKMLSLVNRIFRIHTLIFQGARVKKGAKSLLRTLIRMKLK